MMYTPPNLLLDVDIETKAVIHDKKNSKILSCSIQHVKMIISKYKLYKSQMFNDNR